MSPIRPQKGSEPLTLFACPKPFTNPHLAAIQRNAFTSWTLLRPRPQIILFGDEEGIAQVCRELRLEHVSQVARNEHGTPLLNNIFTKTQQMAAHDLLCYANADLIFLGDLFPAIEEVNRRMRRWLLFSQRWDVPVDGIYDFGRPKWEDELRQWALRSRPPGPLWGLADYFVFQRDIQFQMPPLAIGRTAFDNWIIYRARALRLPVIDATSEVMVVHQRHDYSHHPQNSEGVFRGVEATRNQQLAGGAAVCEFGLYDVTHLLTREGVRPARGWKYLSRSIDAAPALHPSLAPLSCLIRFRRRILQVAARFLRFFASRWKWHSGN